MSAPDRKHDWIEYKTLSLSVPPSRARWRCRGAGAAPRTGLWRGLSPPAAPWGGPGQPGERPQGRDTQGQGTGAAGWGSPAPSQPCPWVPVTARVQNDPWGGDTPPLPGHRDAALGSFPLSFRPSNPKFSPRASAQRQERGPAGGQGRGAALPWAGGKGQENRDEATASSFSLPLILLHSPCSLSLPLPFPLPPSF